jgi:riboflavin synthase
MFTGIISSIGTIDSSEQPVSDSKVQGDLKLKVVCDYKPDSLAIGASIAVSGVCLTVVTKGFLASGKTYFTTTVSEETVRCTAPQQWVKGARVNLEQSLKMGDTLDGHMVAGHVDSTATIESIDSVGDSFCIKLQPPQALMRFVAEKGSVTLDGVSLTVNKVEAGSFSVNIIPHTWAATTLSDRKAGEALNMEVDLLARYVARLLDTK